MNESRSINEPNAVGPGVIYDNEPQTDMRGVERTADGYETVMEEGPTEAYGMEERLEPVQNDSIRARTVVIEPMHYGYVVKLDCHRFAFESADRVLQYIGEYLKDPNATEKKWWNKKLF
jgi:hypothetical protein